jgi:multicomponent Na+:H+ antiporter subunit D
MNGQHLPALQVVLPLLAAPVSAVLRRPTLAWAWTTLIAWISALIAVVILAQVLIGGPISYWIGNWQPPWGIEYRIDTLNAFISLLVAFLGAIIATYARRSIETELPSERIAWYYASYLLCLAGLLGMTVTGDAFNIFVFMEIASLSSYVLIALGRDRRALLAAYQYLIVGTIGATFYVIGLGFLYVMTGTLNIADLAARLPEVGDTRPVLVGIAFIGVGLSLKFALFPLHFWLPSAYAHAPSVATAFLAATATKVQVYLLLRFFFTVFRDAYPLTSLPIPSLWLALSVAAMLVASALAIMRDDIKRVLALSSVAQIGFITLGIGLENETGLIGAIVHLFNHGLMKGALFLLVGGIVLRLGVASMASIAGLGRRLPVTTAGLTLAGLSLIGVPGTVGFVSKWYLLLAAIERGWVGLVAAILLSSLLSLVYIGRILEAAYLRPAADPRAPREPPPSMLIPAWILVLACVYFGLDTGLTVEIARLAARDLLGVGS